MVSLEIGKTLNLQKTDCTVSLQGRLGDYSSIQKAINDSIHFRIKGNYFIKAEFTTSKFTGGILTFSLIGEK
jgi:hypothetical protein